MSISSLKNKESNNNVEKHTAKEAEIRKTESFIDKHSVDEIEKTSLKKENSSILKKESSQKHHSDTFSKSTITALVGSDESSLKRRKELEGLMSRPNQDIPVNMTKSGGIRKSDSKLSGDPLIKSKTSKDYLNIKHLESTGTLSAIQSLNHELPNVEHDQRYVRLFLQKQGLQNTSIWSHLTDVLSKIIAEQPENVIDYFEEYSRRIKQERLIKSDTLQDIYVPSPHLESAQNQISLVNSYGIKEDAEEPVAGEEEEGMEPARRMDLEEAAFYFRHAGVTIPNVQLFTLNVAMKKLSAEKNLIKPRFWGKILGTRQDYFVFEFELTEEEYGKRAEEDELAEAAEAERITAENVAATMKDEEMKEAEEEILKTSEDVIDVAEAEKSIKSEEKDDLKKGEDSIEKVESITLEDLPKEEESEHPQVRFDLPEDTDGEEGEKEEEDPLLPPLPPPKKLLKYKIPPLLEPVLKETVKIPAEKIGEGLNRKIYYVSNIPELEWVELPKVTPEQINVSRQIRAYFTGNMESQIISYPAFPGTEKNYLRTQIARISAATQISPLGFYKFGMGGGEEEEEEVPEEEEEAGGQKTYTENRNFQPIPIRDLIDPSFGSWVHHSQHILKQGRTEWWSAKEAEAGEEEAEEEQEEEEEEEGKEGGEEKESGPPLLTPLSEDATIEGSPAWSVRRTHNYNAEIAAAVIKSNLWPGASAFAVGKKFENVYFGSGHKHSNHGFSPAFLPHPEYEYDLGPEIMEIQDPTVEVEEAWRQAHKKKPPPSEGEEGEGEEGEEEEEEEEEDDD